MARMTPLRRRLIDDMTVRNLSPRHTVLRLRRASSVASLAGRRISWCGEVRAYQIHLVGLRLSWSHSRCAPLEVAEVFRRHGAAYRQAHAGHLSQCQRRVMAAIEACRTAALGGHVEQCDDCGQVRIAYNSCRNRHCPKCQGLALAEWLADRQAELLPVPYFHVVFTVPAPIAEIAFQNKTVVYGILFKAAAETLRLIAADPKHLGAALGLVAVLHTWGQTCTIIRIFTASSPVSCHLPILPAVSVAAPASSCP